MKLKAVTFTGADDNTDPHELIRISEDFPFVEWGVLFGRRVGEPRYPSWEWLDKLLGYLTDYEWSGRGRVRLSAHLCGHWVREVLSGNPTWWREFSALAPYFDRVQLNFHGYPHSAVLGPTLDRIYHGIQRQQFIFQVDGVNDDLVRLLVDFHHGVPLFDRSGGAGLLPGDWPAAWPGVYCGYAGGLGPDNIVDQLPLIERAAGDSEVWIDMESRVRTESGDSSIFDLSKITRVLDVLQAAVLEQP
jgi:hypothetical protein